MLFNWEQIKQIRNQWDYFKVFFKKHFHKLVIYPV